MMWARRRSLALVVVSYNCRSSMTWVSDKGGRVRGLAIIPCRKDAPHHTTPALYRKYFLEAFSLAIWTLTADCERKSTDPALEKLPYLATAWHAALCS